MSNKDEPTKTGAEHLPDGSQANKKPLEQESPETDEEISFAELAPAIEFMCWTIVALAPFLRWANGAAVTDDQWWIQVFLFSAALLGGLSLRIYQIAIYRKLKS